MNPENTNDKLIERREEIKEEFTFYLSNIAKSSRRTENGYNLGLTAVRSYLSFIDVDKLFDYNREKWSYIESMYDITDYDKVSRIVDDLLNDNQFVQHDNQKNQGWRSGSIIHYACFILARSYFLKKAGELSQSHTEQECITRVLPSSLSFQQIFYGAPGTGKSHYINDYTADKDVIRTTFHPDTDYSNFVGAYKPTTIEETVMTVIGTKAVPVENEDGTIRKESKIIYEFVPQAFLQAYVEAWKKYAEAEGEPKEQFLIIEEINRGNCAQIFGDLFQLLDRNDAGFSDYPIQADTDMKRYLQKAFAGLDLPQKESINAQYNGEDIVADVLSGKKLLLPNNLYIWATMNTSDQSLFPIDSAFKRRWEWKYVPIADAGKDWKIRVDGTDYKWWSFLDKVNLIIEDTTLSEDKKLGYFFCKADQEGIIAADKFVGKVLFYLYNDVFKDYGFDGEIFKDENDKDNPELKFKDFFKPDGTPCESKIRVFIDNLEVEKVSSSIEESTNQEMNVTAEN